MILADTLRGHIERAQGRIRTAVSTFTDQTSSLFGCTQAKEIWLRGYGFDFCF